MYFRRFCSVFRGMKQSKFVRCSVATLTVLCLVCGTECNSCHCRTGTGEGQCNCGDPEQGSQVRIPLCNLSFCFISRIASPPPIRRRASVTHCTVCYKIYRVSVGRPEGRRPLGRPRRRWKENIKMDLQVMGWGRHGLD
jgi:hypothetical protein